ncbi:hypothetical protein EDB92DRAFT_1886263, partial [Lactarius akahatsu]
VAEASTQQAFVDILDNDVIKPLRTLKVSQKHLVRKPQGYADYAENTILKLQRAYLKKYYPQQCVHSTDASQCPQDVPNRRFGGKVSTLFRSQREDSRDPEHMFQLGFGSSRASLGFGGDSNWVGRSHGIIRHLGHGSHRKQHRGTPSSSVSRLCKSSNEFLQNPDSGFYRTSFGASVKKRETDCTRYVGLDSTIHA